MDTWYCFRAIGLNLRTRTCLFFRTPREFLLWLAAPGVAEIDRLGGTPTFVA
jgi:hypothetical protein